MKIYFNPLPDITVQELAFLYLHIANANALVDQPIYISEEEYKSIPATARRHLTPNPYTVEPRLTL